jgi:hypothetical protein
VWGEDEVDVRSCVPGGICSKHPGYTSLFANMETTAHANTLVLDTALRTSFLFAVLVVRIWVVNWSRSINGW